MHGEAKYLWERSDGRLLASRRLIYALYIGLHIDANFHYTVGTYLLTVGVEY